MAVRDGLLPVLHCTLCNGEIEWPEEYQSVAGRVWRGHRSCTEAEAAKWVLVRRRWWHRGRK